MEIICKKCKESVSGPLKKSVEAAMARHEAKRHGLASIFAKKKA